MSGFEGEHAVRVQRVAVGAARQPRPRLGLRGRPVGEVRGRVVAARNPGVAPGPEHRRQVAPRVAARIARLRHGGRAPQLGAGLRVMGRDEAGAVLVALAAGHAGDDLPVDDDRTARVAVAEPVVGHGVVPDHLAGPRVEGDDVGVVRVQEDLVFVDGDRPRACAERIVGRPLEALAVLPDGVAGDRVERLHDVQRTRQVHDAVVDDGRGLRQAGGHRPRPDQPELVDVVPVDLVERAVAPAVQRPPPVDPVGRIGVGEHCVGDRREVAVLGRGVAGAGEGEDDERKCKGGYP